MRGEDGRGTPISILLHIRMRRGHRVDVIEYAPVLQSRRSLFIGFFQMG